MTGEKKKREFSRRSRILRLVQRNRIKISGSDTSSRRRAEARLRHNSVLAMVGGGALTVCLRNMRRYEEHCWKRHTPFQIVTVPTVTLILLLHRRHATVVAGAAERTITASCVLPFPTLSRTCSPSDKLLALHELGNVGYRNRIQAQCGTEHVCFGLCIRYHAAAGLFLSSHGLIE